MTYIFGRLHPPVASAVVEIPEYDPDHVYAWKPANNWKGWELLARGEAGVDDADVIQNAVDHVAANGGGTVVVLGISPISELNIPDTVLVEWYYQHYKQFSFRTLDSPLRFESDGYVRPVQGSVLNVNIGTDTTPNSDLGFGIFVFMNSNQAPGSGVVRGPFYTTFKIGSGANYYGWGYTADIEDYSENNGQHVGFYARVRGRGAGDLWGFACEVHDNIDGAYDYAKNIYGLEIALYKENSGSQANGITLHTKGSENPNTAIYILGPGPSKWNSGITIDTGHISQYGIRFSPGTTAVGISMEQASFNGAAIRLAKDNKIDLDANGTYYIKCTTIGSIDWVYINKRVYVPEYIKSGAGIITKMFSANYGGNFSNFSPPSGNGGQLIVVHDSNASAPGARLYVFAGGKWWYVNLTQA